MPARSKSFPSSFVRASAAEHLATTSESTMRVALSLRLRPLDGYDPLPRSLYPILPPPVPHVHFQAMSRSSSNTDTENGTFMADAYHYEGDSEDTDETPLEATQPSVDNFTFQRDTTTNYLDRREDSVSELQEDEDDNSGFDDESEEETITFVNPARTVSMKERMKALKVVDAIKTRSKKTFVKDMKSRKSQKKSAASGIQPAPARRTRSFTRTQPAASQPASTPSNDEIAQPARKPTAEGADQYNHPTKMVLPEKKNNSDWDWILAWCEALDESFDRGRDGLITMTGKIDPPHPVGNSLAALRLPTQRSHRTRRPRP
ncbi:hypothetical protein FRC04_001801 [Tulasnella sp. 424]|nr:hypothetical protein FRC04_001801 [Tulasnella sp. 424]